jgi:hypothetical protein
MARPIWKLGFLGASVLIAVSLGAIIHAGYYHQLWQRLDRYSRLDVAVMIFALSGRTLRAST